MVLFVSRRASANARSPGHFPVHGARSFRLLTRAPSHEFSLYCFIYISSLCCVATIYVKPRTLELTYVYVSRLARDPVSQTLTVSPSVSVTGGGPSLGS